MSALSNDEGRAYEYICLQSLYCEISQFRQASITNNSSVQAAQRAWNKVPLSLQVILKLSAQAVIPKLLELEPMILDVDDDILELTIQKDKAGENGDVRDILLSRRDVSWEVGLSLKHNHFAVKHSRLSGHIDFVEKWFEGSCSQTYWDAVRPHFNRFETAKQRGETWRDYKCSHGNIYTPILDAFIAEMRRAAQADRSLPKKLVMYLLGKFDFYKVISIDVRRITKLQPYNINRTLNKASKTTQPCIRFNAMPLPTRIISLELVPRRKGVVALYMDNGWAFSFRLHTASTKVEASLKFDIQFLGLPAAITSCEINCPWD